MKRTLLLCAIGGILLSASLVSGSCGISHAAKGPDTLKINTTDLAEDVIGFNGPTPVEISITQGVITKIEALPNRETPRFFQMVTQSGLLGKLVGKTIEEAKATQLDAVSGATFSSKAVIRNIQLGLESIGKPQPPKPLAEAQVTQGKVKGAVESGLGTFKAIPFAEAPVGELRWKAPVPKKKWDGVFEATVAGGMPPQQAMRWPGAPEPNITEDCLYLNIQTPAVTGKENLPVLVWIHGGGFITGDAGQDGRKFAKQGIALSISSCFSLL